MDCSGGVLKLKEGFWYDQALHNELVGTTPIFQCLNPLACEVRNNTNLVCPDNAGGALCGICNEGFVPDAGSEEGACKMCDTTLTIRWANKALLVIIMGAAFFIIAFIVMMLPAPRLKIDTFLTTVYVRIILRRFRTKILRQMHEREREDPDFHITRDLSVKYLGYLNSGNFEAVVQMRAEHAENRELQRLAIAAQSAGNAAATVSMSTGGGLGGSEVIMHGAAQLEQLGAEFLDGATRDHMGEMDVDEAGGVMGAIDTAREVRSEGTFDFGSDGPNCIDFNSLRAGITKLIAAAVTQVREWFDPNQFKVRYTEVAASACDLPFLLCGLTHPHTLASHPFTASQCTDTDGQLADQCFADRRV